MSSEDSSSSSSSLFSSLNAGASVRGETPPDVASRCLALCQTYIAGAWNQVRVPESTGCLSEDFTVTRITGGLTNQLFRVRLNERLIARHPTIDTTCTDAAVKLYQSKNVKNYHPEDGERHNDIIVNTIFSQLGIGPKVYGLFNDGMVQQFYEVNNRAPF